MSQNQKHIKSNQRVIKINIKSLSDELREFSEYKHRFASTQELNDMWLEINFSDLDFEIAVAEYILSLLRKKYGRFSDAEPEFR